MNTPTVKDSGSRRGFPTGSVRDAQRGKGRFDLLPFRAIWRLARQLEAGASKYGERNWEKGQPLSVFFDSCQRHLLKAWTGWKDEDHWAAALWNLACLIETMERIEAGLLPDTLDDRPTPSFGPEEMSERPAETNTGGTVEK